MRPRVLVILKIEFAAKFPSHSLDSVIFFFFLLSTRGRRNGINESRGTIGNKRVAESLIFDDRRMRYAILIEHELAEKFYRRCSVLAVPRVSCSSSRKQYGTPYIQRVKSLLHVYNLPLLC